MTRLGLVLLLVTVACVSARNWQFGDNGLTRWDSDCDFTWYDIGEKPSLAEQCGGVCIANPRCTHFTWVPGRGCIMKNVDRLTERHQAGSVCGWIVGRSRQPL